VGRSVVRDLRQAMLAKFLRLPSRDFDAEPVPVMVSRLNYDTEQVAQASTDALKVIVTDTLLIIGLVGVMLWHSPLLTLTMFVIGPLIGGIVAVVGKRYRKLNVGIQEGVGHLSHHAEQVLAAQQEVKVYGAQGSELGRYARIANRLLGLQLKVETTRGLSSSLVQLLAAFALAVIVAVASREALAGRLDAGAFMAVMFAMMALLPSLKRITTVQSAVARGLAAAERIFGVLDAPEEPDGGAEPLQRARGVLEFRDVRLRYAGQEQPALDGISFTARPGTVTAIVGRSGSGKSTLVRLIPRFYDPDEGQVLLDGRPLADYRLVDLRRQVGLVGQKVMLFDDSVAANIAYGANEADAARVRAAAEDANAWEFIQRLPGGLEAHIGENGGRLSGGQRQRLAIARAVLKDAPVLILDEATAALDNESERLVQAALDRLVPDRTTLVIAHRLSTIEHADQVLVLDAGRLVEQGTHAELLARGGLYTHLHRMQFREAEA
jgi:subfamily B ATP-binding cassette protein MsbA